MRRSQFTPVLLGCTLLCAQVSSASAQSTATSQASAADSSSDSATERARTHFKLGVDLYRERNFRAALIEFKRAYKAQPHYKLLYNLGQASLELQEDSSAIEYFTTYLREGQEDIASERRQEVEDTIVRLKARLATVVITANQPGAEIYVDDSLVGTTPLIEPLKLSVGRRTISARKHGYGSVERVLDVAAGDHIDVELAFKDKPAAPEAKLPVQPVAPVVVQIEDSSISAAGWMGISTGVISAGAITMTIVTALAQSAYKDELQRMTTPKRLDMLRDDAKTKALITDITWGAAAASALVTTILLIVDGGSENEPIREKYSAVRMDFGPTSLGVRGQF